MSNRAELLQKIKTLSGFATAERVTTLVGIAQLTAFARRQAYLWVLPCTVCGKDAEPRIKCRTKGPVCLSCCDSCYSSEPFPCPDRERYESGAE